MNSWNVLIVILVIAAFFVLREVMTWYWKLNKIVSLLEEIKENTKQAAVSGADDAVPLETESGTP